MVRSLEGMGQQLGGIKEADIEHQTPDLRNVLRTWDSAAVGLKTVVADEHYSRRLHRM